jgi:diguanylate cyclase (GGDEF)-like protein
MGELETQVSDAEVTEARALTRRGTRGIIPALVTIVGLASMGGGALVAAVFGTIGIVETAVACGLAGALVGLPLILAVSAFTVQRGRRMSVETIVRERVMQGEARRREFETRLARALEMSDDEDAAFDVIGRAMRAVAPDAPVELLLADNSHAHLERGVAWAPSSKTAERAAAASERSDGGRGTPDRSGANRGGASPAAASDAMQLGCQVDSPDGCVAARRAQTQLFHDSEDLDACPMLRGRERGRCSGVCIPVSIMGRTVGVVHATGPVDELLDDEAVAALQTLANQAGNRVGMLRVMAETQLQASTDGLTGLVNRRSLENRMRHLRVEGIDFALVMADLDHFKALNDTFGHEAGDRALRIFSETVRLELRADDMACRYGGEEFAIVLPGVDLYEAIDVTERIRQALAEATGRGDAPAFTASFGIAQASESDGIDDMVQRADRALFLAKDAGRDRICLDGHVTPVASTLAALG